MADPDATTTISFTLFLLIAACVYVMMTAACLYGIRRRPKPKRTPKRWNAEVIDLTKYRKEVRQ